MLSTVTIDITIPGMAPPSSAIQAVTNESAMQLGFVVLPELWVIVFLGTLILGVLCSVLVMSRIKNVKPSEVLRWF